MVSLTNRALVSFIAEENFAGFHHLLESRRVVVDDRDETGATALMIAATRGKASFVRALIEHGADVNAEDEDNWTALLFAAKEGHDELVSELLDHGALVDHRDMGGWTPLMWASYKGRSRAARILMEKGHADVNAYGNYNVTCLAWAAGRGYPEIARDLIQHGAKVNTGDKYGTTPLIWAARKGYIEIVDMLLHAEAMVDASGMTSWTPLLVATAGKHIEVVKLLLDHKPNVNALDKDGCSALSIACKEGFHEIAVMLLNYGAYINVSDRGGSSNLVHAAKGGHRSIVEALLKRHADVNVHGKDRKTALYWAVEKSHVGVVKLILASNPDLEVSTKDGDTALIKAVRNRNIEIVALLLEKRAKVSAADKNGDTALHVSMRARSKQIVELLLRNPVHSQLLYRPNRCGETPYNIDRGSTKPILPQIFGHRGLNTQEDGENLLGYSLYSSALADMLSDPTLNMPITVGLFAKWGSGKSFLLNKLREEMKSFARQWFNPVLSFSYLIFMLTLCVASLVGVICGLSVDEHRWIFGATVTGGIMIIVHSFLFIVWFSTKRAKYEWSVSHRIARYLATHIDSLKLIFQVTFCHPPGAQFSDQMQAQPINFYFTEQGKISSTTGGENSVVQMLGSLYMCLEKDYGTLPTRLYRAFKPRSISSTTDWKWRKLCCVPYCIIFFLCFVATLTASVIAIFAFSSMGDQHTRDHFNSVPVKVVMYSCILFVGLLLVANLYTIGQIMKTIIFSHRRHLQRAVSKMYALKAEGFLNSLKSEVNLITEMVKCLDSFTGKQSRMVVIVDGLDSGEQEKVLQVLDAVHILFSDPKAPFIILLAIDPHIIAKGIELNVHAVMNESNIGGHEYLRNLVHLPFFLQNAALRKVKHVKMLESTLKQKKMEEDPGPQIVLSTRRASVESAFGVAMPLERFEKPSSKKGRRLGLKTSESIASSLGSNLNKAVTGPTDLKKILLGDDYFSDINPKSMRRLMNIIHITGRLLKAFNIDFNWYHLTTWVNVTEQWPYRLSWMILYAEQFQKDFDDGMSLKTVYERVRQFLPISKEVDPNVSLDRDDKKLDVYLGLHKGSLLVSTMYVFLPFTISLDPQLRKDIQEMYQPLDQILKQGPISMLGTAIPPPSPFIQHPGLRYRTNGSRGNSVQYNTTPLMGPQQPFYAGQMYPGMPIPQWPFGVTPGVPLPFTNDHQDPTLMKDLKNKKLSGMTAEGVSDCLKSLPSPLYSNLSKYEDMIKENNICGRVLASCDLSELKQVLHMTFGDWELFKTVVLLLRELEHSPTLAPSGTSELALKRSGSFRLNVPSSSGKDCGDKKLSKPNVLEKQVTMEDQMICGALELLNDEARDDALKGDVSPTSTLSPINSEPDEVDTESKREDRRNSRSPRPSRHLDQDETDVLYVLGSTCLSLSAELPPDSPLLGISKASPKKFDTVFSVANETKTSPTRSRRATSQPKEVEFNVKAKGGILSHSPKKIRSRTSFSERKGVIMNPKSPGMGFDSRKCPNSNSASHSTSSDDESKGLLMKVNLGSAPIGVKRVSTSGSVHSQRTSSPKKRSREETSSNRLSKIRSIFNTSRDGEGHSRSHPIERSESQRHIRNGPFHYPVISASLPSSEPFRPYRSPTPIPPFGSEEYYKVIADIKSDNPSPTSSNESELGSTPENLSSGENLFLPGPPDLPAESPYPRRFVPFRPIPSIESSACPFSRLPTVGFVTDKNKKSSDQESQTCLENQHEFLNKNASVLGQVIRSGRSPAPGHLVKTKLMKSEPVLSRIRSSQQEILSQERLASESQERALLSPRQSQSLMDSETKIVRKRLSSERSGSGKDAKDNKPPQA